MYLLIPLPRPVRKPQEPARMPLSGTIEGISNPCNAWSLDGRNRKGDAAVTSVSWSDERRQVVWLKTDIRLISRPVEGYPGQGCAHAQYCTVS